VAVGTYVAISAQIAMERRLEAIASNIANVNTAGYRAVGVRFSTELEQAGQAQVNFTSPGETYVVRNQGPITHTGNSLDVAIDGDGWFGLNTPEGTVYTRDGRFHLTANGDLQSVNGYGVVDSGGSPITLDATGGPVVIAQDGTITQGGKQLGALGLFLIPADAKLTRHDNSGVMSDKPADPVEDMTANSVRQGYVEGSNVNPILEMTRMIEASRAFDQATTAINQNDQVSQEAIKSLAPTG
jgi:flagellar basal-body rod protein FlgF